MTNAYRALSLLLAMLVVTAGLESAGHSVGGRSELHRHHSEWGNVQRVEPRGKPAVLWFWTPWCPFCNHERNVAAVSAANPAVTFVGVATRADVPALQGFVSKYNLNFTNINDADGSIWARFNVPWQPAYVFLRPDGSSSFVNNPTSVMSAQELTERVRALTS